MSDTEKIIDALDATTTALAEISNSMYMAGHLSEEGKCSYRKIIEKNCAILALRRKK